MLQKLKNKIKTCRIKRIRNRYKLTPKGYALYQYCNKVINNEEHKVIDEYEKALTNLQHSIRSDRVSAAKYYKMVVEMGEQ